MVDVSAVALSGVAASERRLAVAANNIANANTDGFRAQQVVQSSNAGGGVSTQVVTPAATGDAGTVQGSNVSLEKELIETNFATYSAQANLKVLKTQDKLNEYLLDIQA